MASTVCKIMGVLFILVGLWGFVDGHSVLIFHVNPLHNFLHMLLGTLSLAAGFVSDRVARQASIAFGLIYGLVAALGFAKADGVVDMLHLNTPDNWLHAALSLAFLANGLWASVAPARAGRPAENPPAGGA